MRPFQKRIHMIQPKSRFELILAQNLMEEKNLSSSNALALSTQHLIAISEGEAAGFVRRLGFANGSLHLSELYISPKFEQPKMVRDVILRTLRSHKQSNRESIVERVILEKKGLSVLVQLELIKQGFKDHSSDSLIADVTNLARA